MVFVQFAVNVSGAMINGLNMFCFSVKYGSYFKCTSFHLLNNVSALNIFLERERYKYVYTFQDCKLGTLGVSNTILLAINLIWNPTQVSRNTEHR